MKKRLHHQKPEPGAALFDSLVRNAIDFLQKSVQELEKHPKYSVIHFYMALELFLKARLLREHWALVVSKVEKASLQAFQSGDFNSVTIDECLQRLANIANESLLTHEHDCFRTIRDHRNKLVHFFHPDYQPPIDKNILAQIVSEQCKAWFYLHRLLTSKWEIHFANYHKQIAGLQKLIRHNQHFLMSKFNALAPEIEADKKKGISFVTCHVCGYESARIEKLHDPLFERSCLVCDWRSYFLKIPCPQCGKPVTVESEGGGECEECETTIDLDYLLEKLGPYQHPKEESSIARCSECENFEPSVIPFGEHEYLCLNCLTLHDEVGQCGWCGELITGDTSETSIWGCFWCPGPDLKD
ncbi:MAG: hypothetical protein ABSF10_12295 [Verrucomicrobiota bacterium]|jgi:hypothetical protein